MSSPSSVATRRRLRLHHLLAALPGDLAAAGVDEPPRRDRGQPRARVARRVLGPHPQRLQQRLLERVLGGVEVLAPPDHAREHVRDERAQRALVDHDMISRTSIHSYIGSRPGRAAEETYAATSSARSCDSTSIMNQPAIRSLVSGCGPSVVTGAASSPP